MLKDLSKYRALSLVLTATVCLGGCTGGASGPRVGGSTGGGGVGDGGGVPQTVPVTPLAVETVPVEPVPGGSGVAGDPGSLGDGGGGADDSDGRTNPARRAPPVPDAALGEGARKAALAEKQVAQHEQAIAALLAARNAARLAKAQEQEQFDPLKPRGATPRGTAPSGATPRQPSRSVDHPGPDTADAAPATEPRGSGDAASKTAPAAPKPGHVAAGGAADGSQATAAAALDPTTTVQPANTGGISIDAPPVDPPLNPPPLNPPSVGAPPLDEPGVDAGATGRPGVDPVSQGPASAANDAGGSSAGTSRAIGASALGADSGRGGIDIETKLRLSAQQNPKDLAANLRYQLLLFAKGEPSPQSKDLAGLAAEDQQIVTTLLDGLVNFSNSVSDDPDLLLNRKLRPLLAAADRLRARADLQLPTAVLCQEVRGFGMYTPIDPPQFPTGTPAEAILYVEVDNFLSQLNARGLWDTRLRQDLVLYTQAGEEVWRDTQTKFEDVSRNRRRDFFVLRKITLPADLKSGEYVLKVTIVDTRASRVAETRVPLRVVEK